MIKHVQSLVYQSNQSDRLGIPDSIKPKVLQPCLLTRWHSGRSRSRKKDGIIVIMTYCMYLKAWKDRTGRSPRHRRAVDGASRLHTRRTSWPCLRVCPLSCPHTQTSLSTPPASVSERGLSLVRCLVLVPLGLADLLQVGGLDLTGGHSLAGGLAGVVCLLAGWLADMAPTTRA